MIKFFRKIRQNLLSENKFSKYLIYAIGEIILVVIGIMIALQFNNSNEQRKNLNLITETITALEEDLIYNFNDVNTVLNFYKTQDNICKQVLFEELTLKDYRFNDLISVVAANWDIATPKTENSEIILEHEKSANEKLRPIISALKELDADKEILDQEWEVLINNIKQNIKTITQEVSLIKLDSISREQRYQYMLTDEDYKKIIELYWIYAQSYCDQLSRYRAQNMAVLSTIKIVQENYDKEKLEVLYKSIGMNSFTPLDCLPKGNFEKNDELRRGYLIGNLTNEDIRLNIINDGKVGGSYTIRPNEFRDSRPEYAGIGGDYTVIAEQVDESGNCLQKWVAVNKGYLIIE